MFISYAQNFEDVILWRALKDVKNGFYIDIGSENPFTDSVSYGFYLNGWRGLSIEANPSYYDLFKQDRPKDKIINAFISDKNEQLTFYIFDDTGLSTADKTFADIHIQRGLTYHTIQVNSITFDELILEESIHQDVHWMKIDVEGYEKNVLQGWKNDIKPWILVLESMIPNNQISTHEEWEYILFEKGYHFVYADGLNRFYLNENHLDLKHHFNYPPNPLQDLYVSISHHDIGPIMHRAIFAEKRVTDTEMRFNVLDQEKIQSDSRAIKSENWGKELERQVLEQQVHMENKNQHIDELNNKISRFNALLKEQETKTNDAISLLNEKEQEANTLQKKLEDEEERALHLDALLKEQETKTNDALSLLNEKEQEANTLQKKLEDEEERALHLDALLKEQEIKTNDALSLLNEKEQEVVVNLKKDLNNIYSSRSWKITKPLREVNMYKRNFIKKIFYMLVQNQKIKNYVIKFQEVLPQNLRDKIKIFYLKYKREDNAVNFFNGASKTPENLTPNEKEIYQRLLHHIHNKKGN